ncbi:MAG TPA: type I methionyl aminopeptidase [Bacteroidetes bacterium]|nr:type I methionyl aminopeptidase [Bacteroidota bacterium]
MVRGLIQRSKTNNVIYKTEEEIELLRVASLLVCKVLAHVGATIRPGMTGEQLDREAEQIIRDHGATPAFKGYEGPDGPFPGSLCISVNEMVVHGIPSNKEFQDGDIVSIDCGTYLNDFYGDAAYTFPIGDVSEEVMQLCRVTKASLYRGIEQAAKGKRLGDVSYAIQHFTEREHGYSVVRELVGHGVGKELHEDPEVPNFGKRGNGLKIKEGLVIAIEPMINLGRKDVKQGDDGWTIFTKDRKPSAHYEHTIAVINGKAQTLSSHVPVEEAIAKNPNVKEVVSVDELMAVA